jgi:hypothetical protein
MPSLRKEHKPLPHIIRDSYHGYYSSGCCQIITLYTTISVAFTATDLRSTYPQSWIEIAAHDKIVE